MNEREIFIEALQIDEAVDRQAFLDQACRQDPTLRRRLEVLFDVAKNAGSFLQDAAPALAATLDQPAVTERPGTVIGPYKLLQQIGEGGMGTVYMAEQTQPIRRKVAIK